MKSYKSGQNSRLSWKSSSRYRVSQLHPQDSHKNINEDQTFCQKDLGFWIDRSSWAFVMAIEYGSKYMVKHSNLWIPCSEYFHKSPKFAKCLKLGQPSSHQRPFQDLRCHFMQFAFSVHLATAESKFGFDANCVCLLGFMCINPPNILQLKTYWPTTEKSPKTIRKIAHFWITLCSQVSPSHDLFREGKFHLFWELYKWKVL